jgi:energy-coupling factor transporter ATP-binding protein EcfA2
MFINQLRLANVRAIEELTLSFERGGRFQPWTVLLGENGSCKSTLLQAIALAAAGTQNAEKLVNAGSLRNKRNDTDDAWIQAEFFFSDELHPYRAYPRWPERPLEPPRLSSHLEIPAGWSTFKGHSEYLDQPVDPADALEPSPDPLVEVRARDLPRWFVVGYGVNRALPVPLAGSMPAGGSSAERLRPLFQQVGLLATNFADTFDDDLASAYVSTLRDVLLDPGLPSVTGLELRGRGGVRSAKSLVESHRFDLKLGKEEVRLPATWLSHGYQSTIAWIADLVGQVFLEAQQAVPCDEMEGLVLIDELDMHLHPRWQAGFIAYLKEVFPRLQFVATTHSPMVLSGLDRHEVLLLSTDDDGAIRLSEAPEDPSLLTGTEMYEVLFGLQRSFAAERTKLLDEYSLLGSDPHRSDEEETRLRELEHELREANVEPGWEPVPRDQP